ncbi:hypothetical protein A3K80_06630 [Candidatus Bathyarchaeota archaeon RBG_13_38_9]|nr:MAG: hypothetical protein A3K80_06630 [Candidatus Bathyarchaeota archaeon RBG_13_38_9]
MKVPFALVLIIFLFMSAYAAPHEEGSLSIFLTYRGLYDNNLLKYSPRDRGEYLDSIENHQSPIRSLDDFRSDYKISLDYDIELLKNSKSKLRSIFNFAQHLQDPIKNLGWASFYLEQDIGSRLSTSINYFVEPRYYIRDYKDKHTNEYHSADFALNQWTWNLTYRPMYLLEIGGDIRLKNYYYNEYFTEFDGNLWQTGAEVILREGPWKATMNLSYAQFENTGFNALDRLPPYDDIEDNESGNSSYEENEFNIEIQHNVKLWGRRTYTRISGSLAKRFYSSNLLPEIDPLHHGRSDEVVTTGISMKQNLNKILSIEAGWEYSQRDSKASHPLAHILKTYYRWGSWIELTYRLR